jgi:hypothetical protein
LVATHRSFLTGAAGWVWRRDLFLKGRGESAISPRWFSGLGEAPTMVSDSDTSATKSGNGTSSAPWSSNIGEVQNGGVLALLSSMWGSLASKLTGTAQRGQEDELGFQVPILVKHPSGSSIYIAFAPKLVQLPATISLLRRFGTGHAFSLGFDWGKVSRRWCFGLVSKRRRTSVWWAA